MTETPRVVDGADRRLMRLRKLLSFVHTATATKKGATISEMKTFMLVNFGLKHKTTGEYVAELVASNLISETDVGKFTTTDRYKRMLSKLYGT